MTLDAIRKLTLLAHLGMAGEVPWPADRERCASIQSLLLGAGLIEKTGADSFKFLESSAVEVELLLFCIGFMCPLDLPFFLEEHGYASEEELLEVWETGDETKALRLARQLLLKAYHRRYVRSDLRH